MSGATGSEDLRRACVLPQDRIRAGSRWQGCCPMTAGVFEPSCSKSAKDPCRSLTAKASSALTVLDLLEVETCRGYCRIWCQCRTRREGLGFVCLSRRQTSRGQQPTMPAQGRGCGCLLSITIQCGLAKGVQVVRSSSACSDGDRRLWRRRGVPTFTAPASASLRTA